MGTGEWSLEERGGILLARCSAIQEVPGVAHAFSTRMADGKNEFDMGSSRPRGKDLLERRKRFLQAAGLEGGTLFVMKQVHGAKLVRARGPQQGAEADGAVWLAEDSPAFVPSVRTADCVPMLLVDRMGRAAAAVHAGWRGTAARIAVRAVEALARLGIAPSKLEVALGPAILSCCYEVGREPWDRVLAACGGFRAIGESATRAGHFRLDLHAANREQLTRAGVDPGSIHTSGWCTCCRKDLFFSYRRDGEDAGRLMSSVGKAGHP